MKLHQTVSLLPRAALTVTCCPAGDVVKEDDILLQIETDKVTIDVRYTGSEAGTVKEILVKEDDTVSVGQEVVIVETGNVPDDASAAEEAPKEEAKKEPEPAKAPAKKAEAAKPPPTPEKKAEPAKPKPAPAAPASGAEVPFTSCSIVDQHNGGSIAIVSPFF